MTGKYFLFIFLCLGIIPEASYALNLSFVNLRLEYSDDPAINQASRAEDLQSTSIDHFVEVLGADYISNIKLKFYSRLVSQYPILKHVPEERFQDLFAFILHINRGGGGDLYLFIKNGPHYKNKGAALNTINLYDVHSGDFQKTFGGYDPQVILPVIPWPDALDKRMLYIKKLKSDLETISHTFDFEHLLPDQLEPLLLKIDPLLKPFFHLQDAMQVMLANPDIFTQYMREQLLEAQKAMVRLVHNHEISLEEGRRRLGQLRTETAAIETQAKALHEEVMQLEGARTGLGEDVDRLHLLMANIFRGNTSGKYEVAQTANLEMISVNENKERRTQVNAHINAYLTKELHQLVRPHQDEWNDSYVWIELRPRIVFSQELFQSIAFFWMQKIGYRISVAIDAEVSTPSHKTHVISSTLTFILRDGKLNLDSSLSEADSFFSETGDAVAFVMEQERHLPTRQLLLALADNGRGSPTLAALIERLGSAPGGTLALPVAACKTLGDGE